MIGRVAILMWSQFPQAQRSRWTLILTGLLALAFGVAAVFLPANIMFGRISDVIFGRAKALPGLEWLPGSEPSNCSLRSATHAGEGMTAVFTGVVLS